MKSSKGKTKMKRIFNRFFATATMLTMVAAIALVGTQAASVDGTWKFTIETPQGTNNPTVTFKQDGENLTGTYKGRFGESPLKGTIKGNEITFTVKLSVQGQEFELVYTGTVDGDSMKGKVKLPQGEADFTGKKEKA
jgi:hypothetical protein